MSNPSKRRGTKGESDRVKYLQARGWRYARRIVMEGAADKGDLILDQAVPVVIESKEVKARNFSPSTFIKECEAEIENAGAEFGFFIVKKVGTTNVGDYYALCTVDRMMWLIEQVYDKPRVRRLRRVR